MRAGNPALGKVIMSNTYLLYTEAKIDNEWRCIDGRIRCKPFGENKERDVLTTLFESGSRSYFGDAYDELRSIGRSVPFSELSKEIQEEHPTLMYEDSFLQPNKDEKIEAYYTVVPERSFLNHVPDGHEYHGVYHKNMIVAFENGEIEELYEDPERDLKSLSDEERKCYQYYEWDSQWGWWKNFKHLKNLLQFTKDKYFDATFEDIDEVRIVVFCL